MGGSRYRGYARILLAGVFPGSHPTYTSRTTCPGVAPSVVAWDLPRLLLIKKILIGLLAYRPINGVFAIEVPFSQMTQVCIKLIEQNQNKNLPSNNPPQCEESHKQELFHNSKLPQIEEYTPK